MAEEDPDDLEDEIAKLEKEIADLEGGSSDEAPDEADEEAKPSDETAETADQEDEGGRLSSLMGRFKGPSDQEDDEEATDADEAEDEGTPEDEEDSGGALSGFVSRFRGEEDETEPDAPELEEGDPAEETPAPEPEPEPEPTIEETEAPDPEPEPAPSPTEARRREASSRWERTEEGWRRLGEDEVQAAAEEDQDDEDEAPDASGAASLLARFKGSKEDEEEEDDGEEGAAVAAPPPEENEEEEDEEEERSRLVVAAWIIGILLLIALIAAAAVSYLGGSGGSDIQAAITSDALQQDGQFLAATGTTVTFDAGETAGEVDEYRWAFGDGASTTTQGPSAEHSYASRGTYTVTVTAVAGDATSEATLDVLVVQAPDAQAELSLGGAPVAAPGEVGNNAYIGDTVTLDASGSSADPEQSISSYAWDTNGDGSPDATGQTAEVSFDQAGRWVVNLTVTDELGNTGTTSQPIHVSDLQRFDNATVGAAAQGDVTAFHNVTVDAGRLSAAPAQLAASLSYGGGDGGGGPLPIGTQTQSDLDLSVAGPGGTTKAASDDAGEGNESLTVSSSEIGELGQWSFQVTHDQDESGPGAATEVTYTLVVRVIY